VEGMIGFFLNSLVLRTGLEGNPTVESALRRVKATVLEGFANQDVSADLLLDALNVERNPQYTPLVQAAFQLMTGGATDLQVGKMREAIPGFLIKPLETESVTAKFELTLSLSQTDKELGGTLEFNLDLFDSETVEQLIIHYIELAEQVVTEPELPIDSLLVGSARALLQKIERVQPDVVEVWPLTAMQKDMFSDSLVNPQTLQSSHGWAIPINRRLDVALWKKCLQEFSDQEPLLNVRFVAGEKPWEEVGYLVIREKRDINFEFIDMSEPGLTRDGWRTRVNETIYRAYDVANEDLVRFLVIKLADENFVVVTAAHHGILDGTALNNLWVQVTDRYQSRLENRPHTYETSRFIDYVKRNRSMMDTEQVMEFWRQRLLAVEPLDFKVSGRSTAETPSSTDFVTREKYLADQHWKNIKAFCRQNKVTPALYFKCLFGLAINAYCRPDSDFSIQETMAGRSQGHAASQGCYLQEIPFVFRKKDFSKTAKFEEMLQSARNYQREIKEYRFLSIGAQRRLAPPGRVGFMYNFYQFLAHTEFLGEEHHPQGTPSDPEDNVQFVVTLVAGKLKLNLFYHNRCFSEFGFLERVEGLSRQLVENGVRRVGDLQMVTDETESDLQLTTWNDTSEPFDLSSCLHQKFERCVETSPEAVAVVDGDESLSYRELNEKANMLAHYLIKAGVKRSDLVGVCVERSADFLVAILGIMKSGGAYVPLDGGYPRDRVAYMLEDSGVSVLLAQKHLSGKVDASGKARVVFLDTEWEAISREKSTNPDLGIEPSDRAYMLYTSGSTGRPKGAIIRHDGAVNHIEAERKALEFVGSFSFLQTAPVSSDISVWQFLGPVTCGGKTVVAEDATDPENLFALSLKHQVNLVELVPVALRLFIEHIARLPVESRALPHLKWMMATGEAVTVDLVNAWLALYPDIPVVNAYGPTEAADDVIQCVITRKLPLQQLSVPIGKPLANLNVFILDDLMRLVPTGVAGEICVSGVGVGEGYWGDPVKTAESFLPNPFPTAVGDTLYRTGDLGRWLDDGTVEYIGRVDNQVKVRGFRVELEEVEAVLSSRPSVRECVVIVRDDTPGGDSLVAYVTGADGSSLDVYGLRGELRAGLPEYMVPYAIVELEKLPVTPSGKVNRQALPKPEYRGREQECVLPGNGIEIRLAGIWQSLLSLDNISVQDDFFDVGGHSIIGVRMMARVSREFGVSMRVSDLLAYPTIRLLASKIEEIALSKSLVVESSWNPVVTLQRGQPGTELFLVHPVGGDVLCYMELVRSMGLRYSVYGLQARGLYGKQTPFTSLSEMVQAYVEGMMKVQKNGPYRLGGQSLGGVICLELAHALKLRGQEVEFITMLDTFTPIAMEGNSRGEADFLQSALGCGLPGLVNAQEGASPERRLRELYGQAKALSLLPDDITLEFVQRVYRVAKQNHTLVSACDAQTIDVDVYHFAAVDSPFDEGASEGWKARGADFKFLKTAGNHETMMRGANAAVLGKSMVSVIERFGTSKKSGNSIYEH